ncbi:MAG TPA: MOSC domain-containing protein [Acidimicrobiales bacterium]|nr:MOSC domain-containing protein [Acidimicrobiales bacterium]
MSGRVVGIYVAAAGGAPCEAVPSVVALAGAGLEGDRYAVGEGTFSRKPGDGRHVTLVDAAAVAAAGLAPGESRRNIETESVDLLSLVGKRFRIGGVELVATRDCPPCGYLQKKTHRGVVAALQGAGGLRAEVLVGGTITAGDPVEPVG